MQPIIESISGDQAKRLCRRIIDDLPEYFGLPECNDHYVSGVQNRANFAIKINNEYIGLLSLDFPYPQNSNIYWMGVLRRYHSHGYGQLLVSTARSEAVRLGAKTMTVETLAPNEADENYLKTYRFYEKQGFLPLLNLKPEGYEWTMVYMCLVLKT